jgi:uncharacterized protein
MEFDNKTKEEIKSYVYVYFDPDTNQPFYIGKGQNDRCFQHLEDQSESKKVKKLMELKKNNKEPIIELLRYGLTDNEASLLEATLIDFVGLDNLTNKVRGLHSRSFGRTLVKDIILKYTAEDAIIGKDKVILISVGKSFNSRMSEQELYEYARGIWKVDENTHHPEFALIVFQGIIREVYKISKWHKAGTLKYKYRALSEITSQDRKEFEGEKATESVRVKYIGKSVHKYFSKGSRNPIKYKNC